MILTIHFLPRSEKVFRVRESHKSILCLEYNLDLSNTAGPNPHLATQSIPDYTGFRESRVLVKSVCKYIIRDIVAQVANKQAEPGCPE
jgi:hypothetical protein